MTLASVALNLALLGPLATVENPTSGQTGSAALPWHHPGTNVGYRDNELRGVVLDSVEVPSHDPGVDATWVRLLGHTPERGAHVLYLPYVGRRQIVPDKPSTCDVFFHVETISGTAGGTTGTFDNVAVIRQINCDPAAPSR